jgi:phenylacetate-coenzyme A ligase PaaK-like adenylate-forming protein
MINVSGETFFDCQRKNIESVFPKSQLEDSYGSVELGEIAHQATSGLSVFSHLTYIERSVDEVGASEAVITRLGLSSFPFIRYQMKDVIVPEYGQTAGNGIQNIRWIEGKNTTYLEADGTGRIYCSFFNQLVNDVNARFGDSIVEIKVYERARGVLDIQLITRDQGFHEAIRNAMQDGLVERFGNRMHCTVSFVAEVDHDYRRKYRPIERNIEAEWAGGVMGQSIAV